MFEWSEEQLAIRDAVRRFVEEEVEPNVEELEHGDTPPYEVIRKLYRDLRPRCLGPGVLQAGSSNARSSGTAAPERPEGGGNAGGLTLIPIIELCHYCPGIVTALGVSTGLAGGTIMKSGTPAQMERWGLDLMTLDKIGAWAITEPDSGSDALGGMKSTAARDGDEYVLNGNKTFITNGPYADTIVFYAKLDDGSDTPLRQRPVLTFILDRGMPGLEQSKPFRKMGLHSSPTGELFLTDVRAGKDRLLGRDRGSARRERGPRERQGQLRHRAGRRRRHVARPHRGVPQALGRSTPRTGCSGSGRSRSSSSSSSSWPAWRSPASTWRTSCSGTSRWRRPARA